MTDTLITGKAACNASGTLQIALTRASGQVIARASAPFQWSGAACVLPFSFSAVPQLATYGIKVTGLGGGIVWLTPAQAAQTVSLRIGAGFTLSR